MSRVLETKDDLTRIRSKFVINSFGSSLYTDFEKIYGKYLYLPFDIPKIQPNNMADFIRYYYHNSKVALKTKDDFADSAAEANKSSPYLTITSSGKHNTHASIWSGNDVEDIYNKFPELFEQMLEYFPFIEGPTFRWSMWSSNKDIPSHRDFGLHFDSPIVLRVMLFDTNPKQSLSLTLDPLDKDINLTYDIKLPPDSNSFTWNNLRQKHQSVYTSGHRKILMIVSPYEIEDMLKDSKKRNQYIDLLDRSIAKYKDYTVIDNLTDVHSYLNIDTNEINIL